MTSFQIYEVTSGYTTTRPASPDEIIDQALNIFSTKRAVGNTTPNGLAHACRTCPQERHHSKQADHWRSLTDLGGS